MVSPVASSAPNVSPSSILIAPISRTALSTKVVSLASLRAAKSMSRVGRRASSAASSTPPFEHKVLGVLGLRQSIEEAFQRIELDQLVGRSPGPPPSTL